jgi:hypothetical protein
MRETPSLQILCLRVVGSFKCSAEITFAPTAEGEPSAASRLLRSFHARPVAATDAEVDQVMAAAATAAAASHTDNTTSENDAPAIHSIPMKRVPCIGPGGTRRVQANDVDLNMPLVACRADETSRALVMEYGNPALDCLQSITDSLVELGRMDDSRLKKHYFSEWKANVLLAAGERLQSKKRRRESSAAAAAKHTTKSSATPALGSLSLYNCSMSHVTIDAMLASGMGQNLAILDCTGVNGLHDDMLVKLLPACPQLLRLSLKNCRRVTVDSLRAVAQYQARLQVLDVGGAFNITTDDVLEVLPTLTALTQVHASGLSWTDEGLVRLVDMRSWTKLSLGFSVALTAAALRPALLPLADSLTSLALPFCEGIVDNALLGMLGRNLPAVRYLDLRGNPSLTTLTGWYDGRASADLEAQPLHVLGRYSGLSEGSVEDTRRLHPREAGLLTVILDATGTGTGITRKLLAVSS